MPAVRLSRLAPVLAAAPLLAAGLAATAPPAPRAAGAAAKPALGVTHTLAANPSVPGGRHVFAPFGLTNTGAEPLTVQAVRPDCGCLTPLLDRETFDPEHPPQIAPGGSLELICRADTAREAEGPHLHSLEIDCTTPAGTLVTQRVALRYVVGPHEIRVRPAALLVYQREGESVTRTVTVTDRRDRPLTVKAVHSPTERVHVERLAAVPRADGGWDFPFEVTVIGCEGGGSDVVVGVEVDDPAGRYEVLKLPVNVRSSAVLRTATAISEESAGDSGGGRVSR